MALVVFQHSDLTGSERLGEALRDVGHRLRVIDLHHGDDIPVDLEDVDGVITCGGPQSVHLTSLDWIKAEQDFLRMAHEADLPIVGICFGSQMLGAALGGTVEKMDRGEIGWHDVTLNPAGCEDVVHAGIAWTSTQFHWHRDAVTELPPGARVLSSSAACPHQGWALGQRVYAFQYHPEVRPETIDAWFDDDPDALAEAGLTREALAEQTARHYPTMARLADRLFSRIGMLVMPVDRRHQGLIKDLHH